MRSGLSRLAITSVAVAIALAACGDASVPLSVLIEPEQSVAQLDDITRLQTRVYTVTSITEPFATATSAAGSPISGVSCAVIAQLNPDALDCAESERTVTRDRDLIHEGPVPASGRFTVDRPQEAVRVYVELPASELRLDEQGRICNWTTAELVPQDITDATVPLQPRC